MSEIVTKILTQKRFLKTMLFYTQYQKTVRKLIWNLSFKNWFWQATVEIKTSQITKLKTSKTKSVSHAFIEKLNNINFKN